MLNRIRKNISETSHTSVAKNLIASNVTTPAEFFPYGKYVSAMPQTEPSNLTSKNVSIESRNHNLYSDIIETISKLEILPESHEHYIPSTLAQKAKNLLGIIHNNYIIIPPRMMTQDNEYVVFTWELGRIKRYATVGLDDYDLVEIDRKSLVCCNHDIVDDENTAPFQIVELLHATPLAKNTTL